MIVNNGLSEEIGAFFNSALASLFCVRYHVSMLGARMKEN